MRRLLSLLDEVNLTCSVWPFIPTRLDFYSCWATEMAPGRSDSSHCHVCSRTASRWQALPGRGLPSTQIFQHQTAAVSAEHVANARWNITPVPKISDIWRSFCVSISVNYYELKQITLHKRPCTVLNITQPVKHKVSRHSETSLSHHCSGASWNLQCTQWSQPFALRFLKTLTWPGRLVQSEPCCRISVSRFRRSEICLAGNQQKISLCYSKKYLTTQIIQCTKHLILREEEKKNVFETFWMLKDNFGYFMRYTNSFSGGRYWASYSVTAAIDAGNTTQAWAG